MRDLKLSILIPTYNRLSYLKQCIESAEKQTYINKEIIVLNNGSSDGTESWLKDKSSVKVFKWDLNQCSSERFNFLIKQATGDVVFLLHDDDMFFDNLIAERIMGKFRDNPFMEIFIGSAYLINKNNENIGRDYHASPVSAVSIWGKETIHGGTIFYRRTIFDRIGYFDNDLIYNSDYDIKVRILMECQCYAEDMMVVRYRVHGGQESAKMTKEVREKEGRAMRDKLNKRYAGIFI